jgi:flagella basal body P-ring formation protein FlgA
MKGHDLMRTCLLLMALAAGLAPASLSVPALATPTRAKPPVTTVAAKPETPTLNLDVTATRDILTFGDLAAGIPATLAGQPAFRAPALGETGTIQTHRVVEALKSAGVTHVVDGGAAQIVVTRAARHIPGPEIEAAIRRALEERHGVEARALSISFDQSQPSLVVEPDLRAALQATDVVYDARSRRVAATLTVPGSAALRLRPVRVAGQLVETVETIVPIRLVNRGEIIQAGDVAVERRPRDGLPGEFAPDIKAVVGKAARRQLQPGQILRSADLQRQEIIARNEVVTVVYESPGIQLTMRGRAQEAGAQGDLISIQNLQSRKVLQGTVIAPGRVAVTSGSAGRVAAAN